MKRLLLLLSLVIVAGCGSSWLPEDYEVSQGFEAERFTVRPIRATDAEMDYEAVMESIDLIHATLLNDRWPTESFTLEENRADLMKKEKRFERRTSFTYAVLSSDESRVLGSVYINRGIDGPDAAVFMWVRASAHEAELDPALEAAVRQWMDAEWLFEWVVYPGRGVAGAGEGQPN